MNQPKDNPELSSEVQDVDRCVKCGHAGRVNQHGVCVQIRDGIDTDYYKGNPCCMCKCEFPSTSVSEAAPERVWIPINEDGSMDSEWEGKRWHESDIEYARVHQPPEQNSEDKNSVSGASDSSTSRIPKDNLVSADLGVSRAVAAKLLALREMIARSEGFSRDGSGVAEAWHVLYSIADPNFESLTPWAALEALAGQHSTSDVLGNPNRGMSSRNQTESPSESESTLGTDVQAADVMKLCAVCLKPFRYPPSDNKGDVTTCAWCTPPVQPEVSKEQDNAKS